jgi:hypothetical protein
VTVPRPYETVTPTAATSMTPAPEQGLAQAGDGSTVANGALAMIQLAAGTGHVMGGGVSE